jgi:hypothetical protein
LLFLICENYYLEGQLEAFQSLREFLESQNDAQITFMLKYLQLGISIDEQESEKVEALLDWFIAEEEKVIE